MLQIKPIKRYRNGERAKGFDPDDPRFIYVALASDKKHIVCKLDNNAFYELPIESLEAAEDFDGSEPVSVMTKRDGATAIARLKSGLEIDFPPDFVLYHCEPSYEYYIEKIGNSDSIGRNIRSLRQARNLTLADISKRTGIAEPNLSRLEHGKHSPSIDTLTVVAKALKVPASTLLAHRQR